MVFAVFAALVLFTLLIGVAIFTGRGLSALGRTQMARDVREAGFVRTAGLVAALLSASAIIFGIAYLAAGYFV